MKVVHARSGNNRAGIIRTTNFQIQTLTARPPSSYRNGNSTRSILRVTMGESNTLELYKRDQILENPVFLVREVS